MTESKRGYTQKSPEKLSADSKHARNVQNALGSGRRMAERYYIPEALGFTVDDENEYTLFSYYLAQRLLRAMLYNRAGRISHPAANITGPEPAVTDGLSKIDKEYVLVNGVLRNLEQATEDFVEEHFQDDREHAKNIELAINNLVARSTPSDKTGQVYFAFNKEEIRKWGDQWKPSISRGSSY